MTLNEAAAALGVNPATLRQQISNGKLRAKKIGPLWTVSPREVARYRAESLGRKGREHVHNWYYYDLDHNPFPGICTLCGSLK